jgi:hypothetical protein
LKLWAKLLIAAALLGLTAAKPLSAQGQIYSNIAWRYTPAGVFPASGATITICTVSATGSPCSPTVTIYQDSALSIPVTNPLAVCLTNGQIGCADGLGNFSFYVSPGAYSYSISGSGLNAYGPIPFGVSCVSGVTCAATSAINTWTALQNFPGGIGTNEFDGPSPWYDITAPPFGALCNGSHDDGAAILAAAAAAEAAGGGKVYTPPSATPCIIGASGIYALNFSGYQQVEFVGPSAGAYGINLSGSTPVNPNQKGWWQFTGNPSSGLISAQGTFGVTFQNLLIQYTNTSFTGLIVDTSHNVTANDTQKFSFLGNAVTGTSSAQGAACGVCLDKTINSTVRDSNFSFMKVYVRGLAGAGSYSNGVRVEDNMFGNGNTAAGTTSIQDPGQGWVISGNVFELGVNSTTQSAIDATLASSQGLGFSVAGNWFGDAPATWTGALFNQVGTGFSFTGNNFSTSGTASGTLFNFQGAANGITVVGNLLGNAAVGFVFTGSNQTDVLIAGNGRQTLTTFQTGAPATGLIKDANTGFTNVYGTFRAGVVVADQGTVCTNGELVLSSGWQSTGTATVTAVAGNGQTCSWTITTGTTTAASPTITDTLTNPLPEATTVCELNVHGGTHTPAAGEGFTQTTLSATAPVFTFIGTPTANGFTYFVTRRCGP